MNKTRKPNRPPKRLSVATTSDVIDALGGVCAVSRLTDVSSSAVAGWKKRGMPKSRVAYLREAFKTLPVMRTKEVIEL